LSRIPGEERKFKRRRIVALVPGFKCEREAAVSHAEGAGVDVEAEGVVAVGEGRGAGAIRFVSVGEGTGVTVSVEILVIVAEGKGVRGDTTILVIVKVWVGEASGVLVGSGGFVAVGVELTTLISVEAGSEATVDSESLVGVGVWIGTVVDVGEVSVDELGSAAEVAPDGWTPGVDVVVALGMTVDSNVGDWGGPPRFRTKKRINKRTTTLNLKRS
jgi:hypothetical protein